MGCFSFECKVCGKPGNSDSFSGEHVRLCLLEKGEIIEEMAGQYDSYGRVFDDKMESRLWKSYEWGGVCDLMFNKDPRNGIALIHTECDKGMTPTTRSEGDPDQGWGRYQYSRDGENYHKVLGKEI